MNYSRRDLSLLLPMLAAVKAGGSGVLPSGTFSFDKLPVQSSGENQTRPVLDGETHAGVRIELHETELPPGGAPHPPHHHVHEEMLLIREGTMEVTIAGKSARLGPGPWLTWRPMKSTAGTTPEPRARIILCCPSDGIEFRAERTYIESSIRQRRTQWQP